MIKLLMFFDEKPNALDDQAYTKYVQQTYKMFEERKKTGDLIQYKMYSNVLGTPGSVSETEWKSMSAWVNFWESKEYQHLWKSAKNFMQSFKVYILKDAVGP